MAEIKFTIPNEKLQRVIDATCGLHSIPKDDDGVDLFTPQQWTKEYHRRLIVNDVHTWEKQLASNSVQTDNDIVT